MARLTIRRPGLQTTVQDLGRWGYQSEGVPVAGPMDPFAHRAANILAGNGLDAATLEITLTGPQLVCSDDRIVAIAGAAFEITLDGGAVDATGPFQLPAGAVLRFGRRLAGARAYLAVAGGIAVPRVLGSRATHVMTAMGGHDGRPLVAGDELPLGRPASGHHARGRFDRQTTPGPAVIRVLPGPQDDRFAPTALEQLQSAAYLVTRDSNRTGYRLEGPPLAHRAGADVISDATPLGSLQVPASGQPILLMADRQTAGGYAKVATVIAADIGVAGQLAPGDSLWFRVCSRHEAVAALIARERALLALDGREAEG